MASQDHQGSPGLLVSRERLDLGGFVTAVEAVTMLQDRQVSCWELMRNEAWMSGTFSAVSSFIPFSLFVLLHPEDPYYGYQP